MEGNWSKQEVEVVSLTRLKSFFKVFIDQTFPVEQTVLVFTVHLSNGGRNNEMEEKKYV